MSRHLTSAALAAAIVLGSATIAQAMQGPRTSNPPGPDRPAQTQQAPSGHMDHGPMMGSMGQGMMGNPQMQAQMSQQMQDCPCCQRMAQMDSKRPQQR